MLENSSYTCFFRKRDFTASWVADTIWPQHFEENFVLNLNFCKFSVPEKHLFFLFSKTTSFQCYILELHLIGLKKINSQAAQNWSKSVPMVFLWPFLRWFFVT
jgi:hypothetical protein